MLPRQHRITRSAEFTRVVRRGTRVKRATLVVHLMLDGSADDPPRAGFVVSRAVGNAVVRHRVTRRLRHLVRDRLEELPRGSLLVVRARPPAATAVGNLADDLDDGVTEALRRGRGR